VTRQIPKRVEDLNHAMGLLRAALRRANPKPLAPCLRDLLPRLVRHWLDWRRRGHFEIYPGVTKLAKWAGCSDRNVRTHLRTLEAWGVMIPLGYRKGGRRATRYAVSGEALFRALVVMGCNPSDKLRSALREFDLPRRPAENPEVVRRISSSYQLLEVVSNRPITSKSRPKVAKEADRRNAEENPEVTSAGIQDYMGNGPLVPEAAKVPLPASPPAGRSADASLFVFHFLSKNGRKAEHPAGQRLQPSNIAENLPALPPPRTINRHRRALCRGGAL